MTVAALQARIAQEATDRLLPALLERAALQHRKGWRDCDCTWCKLKQEATLVIGSHVPRVWRGFYVEDIRDAWRDEQRVKYRRRLAEVFGE